MRVKIGELKTHFSKYVQSLREGGDPIEVCVRDKTVAYLTRSKDEETADLQMGKKLAEKLERRGLRLRQLGRVRATGVSPGEPGDGCEMQNSIVAIRSEKDW